MRGDRPPTAAMYSSTCLFTPHARGSTVDILIAGWQELVYPACAGIDPVTFADLWQALSLPRMRGDRPTLSLTTLSASPFTPHARGSTERTVAVERDIKVYPACAGIDPIERMVWCDHLGLPRMRGDRPAILGPDGWFVLFTPHARGSTRLCSDGALPAPVYPACAGIDLSYMCSIASCRCLPRMRGDRPEKLAIEAFLESFTPHARGSTAQSDGGDSLR